MGFLHQPATAGSAADLPAAQHTFSKQKKWIGLPQLARMKPLHYELTRALKRNWFNKASPGQENNSQLEREREGGGGGA